MVRLGDQAGGSALANDSGVEFGWVLVTDLVYEEHVAGSVPAPLSGYCCQVLSVCLDNFAGAVLLHQTDHGRTSRAAVELFRIKTINTLNTFPSCAIARVVDE